METIKLLITARDPASANDIITVLLPMLGDERFTVRVLAQYPAYDMFLKKLTSSDVDTGQLIEFKPCKEENKINDSVVISVFNEFHPDCVLTGISGPDNYGVDEILLNVSKKYKNIKTFSIQSYWGDVNRSLGILADTIFVMDEFAKEATLLRDNKCNIVITGPLQSKRYNEVNIDQERAVFRNKYNTNNVPMIGLFGQPLFDYEWYKSTMASFIDALTQVNLSVRVVYKPHPKESEASVQWTTNKLIKSRLDFFVDKSQEALKVLTGTDVAVSLFSTIGYDLQNLLRKSKTAFSIPFYLFFDDKCKGWFKKYCYLEEIPMSKYGSIVVNSKKDIIKLVQQSLSSKEKELCHSMILERISANCDSNQYDIVSNTIIKIHNTQKEK